MRLLLGAVLAAIAAVSGMTAATAAPPLAAVHVSACQRASTTLQREATFVAIMNAIPATDRMEVRFTLEQRVPGHPDAVVLAPGLDVWRMSRAGVSSFGYAQTVNALAPKTIYTMVVTFRWLDASGQELRTLTRSSAPCSEVGPLANLRLAGATSRPGALSGTDVYDIRVTNAGRLPDHDLRLKLFVDGVRATSARIPALAAGETATVEMTGPSCMRTLALAAQLGRDRTQRNILISRCPAGG